MDIPNDVIEAMIGAIVYRPLDCGGKGFVYNAMIAALDAAEAKGWKLCPRAPTAEMISAAPLTQEYAPLWGAAPSAKEAK